MRISILGYSGSGKSTLAAKIGSKYGIPVLHLDTLHFLPNWVERDNSAMAADVAPVVAQPDWVIDGNYSKAVGGDRHDRSDTIIILLFPRLLCLYRAIARYYKYKGTVRASVAAGCPEKLDAEFIRWILYKGRTAARRSYYRSIKESYPERTYIIKSPHQLSRFTLKNFSIKI